MKQTDHTVVTDVSSLPNGRGWLIFFFCLATFSAAAGFLFANYV